MLKYFASVALSIVVSAPAFSGSLTFNPPVEEQVVSQREVIGQSNVRWVVPLIALGVVALAVSSGGGDDPETSSEPPKNLPPEPPKELPKIVVPD